MAQNRGTSTGRVEQPRAARAPVPLRPRLEGAARGSARQRGSRTHGLRELRAARDGKAATGPPGASPQRLKGKCLRRTAGAPLSALPLHTEPPPRLRAREERLPPPVRTPPSQFRTVASNGPRHAPGARTRTRTRALPPRARAAPHLLPRSEELPRTTAAAPRRQHCACAAPAPPPPGAREREECARPAAGRRRQGSVRKVPTLRAAARPELGSCPREAPVPLLCSFPEKLAVSQANS